MANTANLIVEDSNVLDDIRVAIRNDMISLRFYDSTSTTPENTLITCKQEETLAILFFDGGRRFPQ